MVTLNQPEIQHNITKSNRQEARWCIDTQERALSFAKPFDFDSKFGDAGMRRGYELLGRVNMEAYIG
jgi:hypothetical protein